MTVKVVTLDGEIGRKPYPYEKPNGKDITDADIYHATDFREYRLDVNLERHKQRTIETKFTASDLYPLIQYSQNNIGMPVSYTVRVLYSINEDSAPKQFMPLHHDFNVNTYKLTEILLDEQDNMYYLDKSVQGPFHGVLSLDGESKAHCAITPPKSTRLAVFLFTYPHKDFQDNKIPNISYVRVKMPELFEDEIYKGDITYKEFYERVQKHYRV